jgi:HAD superfamily hydrolase (TIGR01509 family)
MSQLPTPDALIFDMDGLMVDSEPLWLRVEHQIAARHGARWSEELALRCVGTGLPNTARVMIEELGLPLGVGEGAQLLIDTFAERLDELELKPGMLELLEASAHLKRAVASSSSVWLIDRVLERFALRERFDVVMSGESVPRSKPAPDLFLAVSERLAVAPERCVVLEDSLAGVQGARAAGIPVIAVPEHQRDRIAAAADRVADDLHHAKRMLGL